jgi:hypothetical protein
MRLTIIALLLTFARGASTPGSTSATQRPTPTPSPVFVSRSQAFSMPQHFEGGKYNVHWQLFANDTGKGLIVYLADPRTGQKVKDLVSSGADAGDQVITIPEGDYAVTVATLVRTFTVTLTRVSA